MELGFAHCHCHLNPKTLFCKILTSKKSRISSHKNSFLDLLCLTLNTSSWNEGLHAAFAIETLNPCLHGCKPMLFSRLAFLNPKFARGKLALGQGARIFIKDLPASCLALRWMSSFV